MNRTKNIIKKHPNIIKALIAFACIVLAGLVGIFSVGLGGSAYALTYDDKLVSAGSVENGVYSFRGFGAINFTSGYSFYEVIFVKGTYTAATIESAFNSSSNTGAVTMYDSGRNDIDKVSDYLVSSDRGALYFSVNLQKELDSRPYLSNGKYTVAVKYRLNRDIPFGNTSVPAGEYVGGIVNFEYTMSDEKLNDITPKITLERVGDYLTVYSSHINFDDFLALSLRAVPSGTSPGLEPGFFFKSLNSNVLSSYLIDSRTLRCNLIDVFNAIGLTRNVDYDVYVLGVKSPVDYNIGNIPAGTVINLESSRFEYNYAVEISLPPDPVKEGHTFAGWFYDEEFTRPVTDEPIYQDIPLYAKFEINKYTVRIHTLSGTVEEVIYDWNTAFTYSPLLPEGHTFIGYYTDAAYTSVLPGDYVVKSDIDIYLKYEIKLYTVTFIVDGEIYKTVTVPYGAVFTGVSAANAPVYATELVDVLMLTGEVYADDTKSAVYDFTIPVTKDVTVYGEFSKGMRNWIRAGVWFSSNWGWLLGVVLGVSVLVAGAIIFVKARR